jgi:hypothetical protein
MTFTVQGIVILMLGMIAVVFGKKIILIRAAIFFSPFTAFAVINFLSGFWLTPFQYFMILCIGIKLSQDTLIKKINYSKPIPEEVIWVAIFFIALAISSFMPLLIDGDLFINGTALNEEIGPLFYSTVNFTRPFYIIFGFFASFLISGISNSSYLLNQSLRVYIFSGFVVATWGLMQFVLNMAELEYPYYIFNNSLNPVSQGYSQMINSSDGGSFKRLTSVLSEPSVMSQMLIPIFALLVSAKFFKVIFFSRLIDFIFMISILLVCLFSTSATAYFGIFICMILALFMALFLKNIQKIYFVVIFIAGLILVAMLALDNIFSTFIENNIVDKLSSGSGEERILTIKYALDYFSQYPLFGIGLGSFSSNDFVVLVLASLGIFGFLILMKLLTDLFAPFLRLSFALSRDKSIDKNNALIICTLILFIISIILQMTSGFNYGYGYFWVTLGLCIGARSNAIKFFTQRSKNHVD